eukprot:439341_1
MASLPTSSTNSMEWTDVTDVLSSVTSKMGLGEMICSPDFNLHSAMSALEIGDGVLDAAMKERLLYMEDVLNDDALMSKLMTVCQNEYQLIGTLDELLKLLWSFFNGNSDQFSIYSCLYLYDEIRCHEANTKNNNNHTLYLFIDTVKLCCGYARKIVTLSGISEDEDWSKNKHFDLFHDDDLQEDYLLELTSNLQATIDDYKSKLSENSDSKQCENDTLNDAQKYSKSEYAQALCYRFEFVSGLLHIMRQMYAVAQQFELDDTEPNKKEIQAAPSPPQKASKHNKPPQSKKHSKHNKGSKKQKQKHKQKGGKGHNKKQNKGKGGPKTKGNKKQTNPQPKEEKKDMNNGLYLIDVCAISPCALSHEMVNGHKSSILQFKPLASGLLRDVNHLIESASMGMDEPCGFDDRIGNIKSVHSPRKQRIPPKLECFKSWKNWCKSLRFMCHLCSVDTFDGFLEFLDAFNRHDEFPNVVIRSLLTIIIEQFAKYDSFLWSGKPLIHFLQQSFGDLCEWCRIFPNTNEQYLGDYHTFYSRVETAVRDVIRQKLLHITRQMDWSKRIIKNWQILQCESPEIDRLTALSYLAGFEDKYHATINQMEEYKAQPAAFTGWIIDQCCSSMIHYIFIHLSKHMELYAAYELEYVYYYLEYLFRNKIRIYEQSLRRFQAVDIEKLNEIMNPNYAAIKARRKHKKRSKKETKTELLPPIDPNDEYIYVLNDAQRCLCLAIFELIQSFYQINKENSNCVVKWNGLSDRVDLMEEKESKQGQYQVPQRLGDESLRFAHRFNIFLHVDQPVAISYRQFRSIMFEYQEKNKLLSDKFKQLQAQLDQSSKCFGLLANAKQFDHIPSYQQDYIRTARKVAVMNKIFASKLFKCVTTPQQQSIKEINIEHKFNIHSFYPVFDFAK